MIRLLFLFVFISASAYGQKQGNIWYFGDGYGLDFNSTPPTLLDDGQTAPSVACGDLHIEGTASIADSSGSLLFYTDGQTLWNKNHQPMPNGTGLLGGSSSTQAALIVPRPESDTRYYVFTTDDFCNGLANGLRYSIVDICEDNTQGDVVPKLKNILLQDTMAEKLAAVRHANGTDYWVLSHGYFSNKFYAFQVTPQGVEPPIISSVGSIHEGGGANNMWNARGQLKFAPLGNRVAIGAINTTPIFELFDFDNSTGVLSNLIELPSLAGAFGIAFSPEGTKLYETPIFKQYDLTAGNGNVDSIMASGYEYLDPHLECGAALQLGPDGKIYMYNCFDNDISVIHNPDLLGASSNAEPNVYTMQTNALVYGLPAMVADYDYTATGICDPDGIADTARNTFTIQPNPANTSTTLTLPVAGTYDLMVLDAMGREVHRSNLTAQTSNLNTSQWPRGIYAITATNKEGVRYTGKLVVGR